jgi:hypothetical protein
MRNQRTELSIITAIILEPISKMSFGLPPFSAGLGPRFKPSIRLRRTGALKLGPAAILNQNPIFEMGSNKFEMMMVSGFPPDSVSAI